MKHAIKLIEYHISVNRTALREEKTALNAVNKSILPNYFKELSVSIAARNEYLKSLDEALKLLTTVVKTKKQKFYYGTGEVSTLPPPLIKRAFQTAEPRKTRKPNLPRL